MADTQIDRFAQKDWASTAKGAMMRVWITGKLFQTCLPT
jgi:hypothetical protein